MMQKGKGELFGHGMANRKMKSVVREKWKEQERGEDLRENGLAAESEMGVRKMLHYLSILAQDREVF